MHDSHPSLYCTKTDIICTFLIHYGSLQKMLTALFDFLWNTQKRNWTNFFEWPGKMLLSIEKLSLSFLPYVWVQREIFTCLIIELNLNIKINFCARLGFNVFWFVKCMKIRKLKIEIISI